MSFKIFKTHKRVQFPRASTAVNDGYTGLEGELTIDKTRWELRLRDGVKPGGRRILNIDQLASIFLQLNSEAGGFNFGVNTVGFLARIANKTYALRKLKAANGITIDNFDGKNGHPVIGLPSRLAEESDDGVASDELGDLNDLIESGMYAVKADAKHLPTAMAGQATGGLWVIQRNDNTIVQVLVDNAVQMHMYTRSMVSGSWRPWNTIRPLTGTYDILDKGTDTVQRTWSAADIAKYVTEHMKDVSDDPNDVSFLSKRIFRDVLAGPQIPNSVYNMGAPVAGDRMIIYVTAAALWSHSGINFEDAFLGGDCEIQMKMGTAWVTVDSMQSEADSYDHVVTQRTVKLSYVSNTQVVLANADWAILDSFAGAWTGEFRFKTNQWTQSLVVAGYRNRVKT